MPNIYLTVNHYNFNNGILPFYYIGSDQNDNSDYYGSSVTLKEDIALLGDEVFSKSILKSFDSISNQELRRVEAFYLKFMNVKHDPEFYNLTDLYGPAGGKKGMKMPPRSLQHRINWANARRGWNPSEETRKLWRSQRIGRVATNETKKKMSEKQTGALNANALEWELVSPIGEVILVKGLRAYCRENNLPFNRIYSSKDGWKVNKFGKGKGGGRHAKC